MLPSTLSILSVLLGLAAMAMPGHLTPVADTPTTSADYPPMNLSTPPEDDGSDAHCDRLQKRGINLEHGYWHVGGTQGEEFDKKGCHRAQIPKRIDVWHKNYINGIKISCDEEDVFVGKESGIHTRYKFNGMETITEMKIQARRLDCHNSRGLGMITFTTSMGNTFSVRAMEGGHKDHNGYRGIGEYSLNVHGGYLCGMYGRSETYINRLGFYFLPEIESVDMTDVTYKMDNVKSQAFYSGMGAQGANYGSTTTELTGTYSLQKEDEVTHKWSHRVAVGLNLGFGINAEYGFRKDTKESSKITYSQTKAFKFTFEPMCWNYAEILYNRRTAENIPMSGVMRIVFADKTTFNTKVTGSFSLDEYTDASIKLANIPFSESFEDRHNPKHHELGSITPPVPFWKRIV